jgi:hypothetical protein
MPTDLSQGFAFAAAATRPRVAFGLTNPAHFFDKMSAIDRAAADLDPKIRMYSQDPQLKAAWDAWYAHWQRWYTPYKSLAARWFTLPFTIADSDAIDAQTDAEWREYVQLQSRYEQERDAAGRSLPSPITPLPVVPPAPQPSGPSAPWSVPTWLWVVLGIGVVGLGAYAYFQYKEIKAGVGAARRVFGGGKSEGDMRRDYPPVYPPPMRDPFAPSWYAPHAPPPLPAAHHAHAYAYPPARDCGCPHEDGEREYVVDYDSDDVRGYYR